MKVKNLKLKEKRQVSPAGPGVPGWRRFMVTVGADECEVKVDAEGMVRAADEPLDEWIDLTWSHLKADAKRYRWEIVDLDAPKEAKAPPMEVTGVDPAVAGKALTSIGPGKLPIFKPSLSPKVAKDLSLLPPGDVMIQNEPTAWSTSSTDLEKIAKRAEAKADEAKRELDRVKQEMAVAMAKEGRGNAIDEMNKLIFAQPKPAFTPEQERRLRDIVTETVLRVARMMGGGNDERFLREIEERVYRESHERARRELAMATPMYQVTMDPRAKPFEMPLWEEAERGRRGRR